MSVQAFELQNRKTRKRQFKSVVFVETVHPDEAILPEDFDVAWSARYGVHLVMMRCPTDFDNIL